MDVGQHRYDFASCQKRQEPPKDTGYHVIYKDLPQPSRGAKKRIVNLPHGRVD